jgi:hypothetical protein
MSRFQIVATASDDYPIDVAAFQEVLDGLAGVQRLALPSRLMDTQDDVATPVDTPVFTDVATYRRLGAAPAGHLCHRRTDSVDASCLHRRQAARPAPGPGSAAGLLARSSGRVDCHSRWAKTRPRLA